ncbi:MAG: hypothetical protein KF862_27285, partial [Chitinophagaceae bacterium]|nr:hypothetical protein [Chitinophagaceae bacterium]
TGFEPAASSSRTKRATGLRYIPKDFSAVNVLVKIKMNKFFGMAFRYAVEYFFIQQATILLVPLSAGYYWFRKQRS